MPKFEAKIKRREILQKFGKRVGGGTAAGGAPPSMVFCAWSQKVSVCHSKRFS